MKKLFILGAVLITSVSIAQVPTNGLVGYWPFNGNANDESVNGNNGTVNGAILTTDRKGNINSAYGFDGIDDFINIQTPNITSVTTESYSLWIKWNGGWSGIFEDGDVVLDNTPNRLLQINSGIRALPCDNQYTDYTSSINQNEWYHIVWLIDGTTDKIYINGNLKVTGISITDCATQYIHIGAGYPGYFKGSIDDIRIYNRVLTEQEIIALYNESGTPPSPTPPSSSNWQINGNNIFYNNGTGNVGIGVNNPPAKLTTLHELELYINNNGHLPEIPTAKEAEKELNLAEMNLKLLQKVEELTLYIIEQDKKIVQQNLELTELKKKVEKTESGLK